MPPCAPVICSRPPPCGPGHEVARRSPEGITMAQLFDGLKVLELAGHAAGPFAGKLFADYGADVIKIEPPEGDRARHEGPFKDDTPDPETSALFLHLNTHKKSVTLDVTTDEGRGILRRLIDQSDIVIE